MTKIISVYYGSTGLTPTIDIFELNVANPLINTLIVNDGVLTEIGAGWYRYDFVTYSSTQNYVYTIDGGVSLSSEQRYRVGGNESYVEDISSGVWEEPSVDHLNLGTTGFMLTQIKSDTTSVMVSQSTITSLINTVLKYERNRTRIDVAQATLTIYDDDGTTPLTTFSLKDHLGNLSVAEVCERIAI